jgi:ATP-dependent helicase Lhr and Lhr-like helicase
MWKAGTADATERLCLPDADQRALDGLKFSEALPERLATATLAARLSAYSPALFGSPSEASSPWGLEVYLWP